MAVLYVPQDLKIAESRDESLTMLTERLAELELALEDEGWLRLSTLSELEFSRDGLRKIAKLARIMYLKNPLIQRGVNVQTYYVYGQGMNIRAKDPDVNAVVQSFLSDKKNKAELTSHQARMEKEIELQIESNLFFTFFTNASTGKVTVRTIPPDEVEDIICNPEDAKDHWYYKRSWIPGAVDMATGIKASKQQTAYYPDWQYYPTATEKPQKIGAYPVMWDIPVYHVRTGGLPRARFGISEVYAAIDWARAYKDFLENWSTIVQAYARFAWRASGMGSKAAVDAMKTKFGSTLATGTETNPPPTVASLLLEPGNVKMDPIRTAGATTSADDGRQMKLMAAMVFGVPETFFGDTSVGTLATAKSLDRPTELKMLSRQTLWADIHRNILDYVVMQAVKAPSGLAGTVTPDDEGMPQVELAANLGGAITVSFPPILEHDVDAAVKAISTAATLDGKVLAGTIDLPAVARMMLNALGEDDIDAILEKQFPVGESAADTKMIVAVKDLAEAVREARVAQ
jgi:hypothetical protein